MYIKHVSMPFFCCKIKNLKKTNCLKPVENFNKTSFFIIKKVLFILNICFCFLICIKTITYYFLLTFFIQLKIQFIIGF